MSPLPSSKSWSLHVSLLFAFACGLAVANIYYTQPLLGQLAKEFSISYSVVGTIIAVVQLFYAIGLLLIVPLGDFLSRRRMISTQLLSIAAALLAVGFAKSYAVLLAALAAVGLMAVVTQVLVNFASALAPETQRGQVVGIVTSGVVIGILLARTFAGIVSDLAGWRAVYLVSSALTFAVTLSLLSVLPRDTAHKPPIAYGQMLKSLLRLFVTERLLRIRAALALFIFTAFGILWTPLALELGEPPLSLSPTVIGLFGLAGAAGALGAVGAGRLADRGLGKPMTRTALVLLLVSWLPIGMLHYSLALLVVGILLLDFAVQAVHVTNQSLLFAALPAARGRLTGVYMIFYSFGSALGAFLSTRIHAAYGWNGVALLGAFVSSLALLFWIWTQKERSL
ncbi:MFS transporter [Saccharibacillus kuerlensis]|uniref:MFS transporter n=1 Tax=Saccharibacillus kuerlensis TaxID=459527 RepID=A0ABQ2KRK0_9BACL|nr:MFS transporter [Saccharibacillus kuerlensis]GGN91178.1 MFS transporter [Saccharibacillus kuerlensis]